MWADAVFEGGGVKGIGLVGALCVAESNGYRWKKVAGTSAGSIIATLVAAGYTAEELYKILVKTNFRDFTRPSLAHKVPLIGPAIRLWFKNGLYTSNTIEKWMEDLLAKKGIKTFADMKEKTKLHIIVSDITSGKITVLPDDLSFYGIPDDKMSVAKAVRMSCSIPFFFDPVKMQRKNTARNCYMVDGGLLSNFPVWLFDRDEPRWPTFGFRLHSSHEKRIHEINTPFSLLSSMFFTMMDAHDNRHIANKDEVRTIQVPTLDIKMTDFEICDAKREELFQAGILAGEEFFNKFTFDTYLAVRGKKSINLNIRKSNERGG